MNVNPSLLPDEAQYANAALNLALGPYQNLRSFADGTVVFSEGDWPAGVFVVIAGGVDMDFSAQPGAPVRMRTLGTILGLNAVISGRAYDYTARACENAVLGFLPKEKFLSILNASPGLWLEVLKVMSRDIGSCYERVRELSAR